MKLRNGLKVDPILCHLTTATMMMKTDEKLTEPENITLINVPCNCIAE